MFFSSVLVRRVFCMMPEHVANFRFTAAVRTRTRPGQEELEARLAVELNSSELNTYRSAMLKLFSVWSSMEEYLQARGFFQDFPYLRPLLRADKLRRDLKTLSGGLDEQVISLPDVNSVGSTQMAAYGLAYAWSNSIHSVQVLILQLHRGLHLTRKNGATFLFLDDSLECREAILEFLAWLDLNLAPHSSEVAIDAALKAYTFFNGV